MTNTNGTVRVWTFQPAIILDVINQTGEFICDKSKSFAMEAPQFEEAYEWLIEKMEEKIGKRPEGVEYPIWAWYRSYGKNKKPDLRRSEYRTIGKPGEKWICIELELNEDEVVLSDEPAWTVSALNGCPFNNSSSEEEWEEINERFKQIAKEALSEGDPEKYRNVVKESWNHVFNIEPFSNEWFSRGEHVQATFWKIKKEQIKNITYFKSR